MQRSGYSPIDAQINFAVPSLSVIKSYNEDHFPKTDVGVRENNVTHKD